jgi:hypothetical protein
MSMLHDDDALVGGLVGLIDASDQLQKHLENLKPVVEEADLNPTIENWFAEEDDSPPEVTPDSIDQEYVLEAYPDTRQAAERVTDMLQEESAYILRQATSALNKVKSK